MDPKNETKPKEKSDFVSEKETLKISVFQPKTKQKKRNKNWKGCYFASCS